jgi:hypothetical protein
MENLNANVEQTTEVKQMTQAEIDRIVEERLARERKKYSDYEDVKGVLDELKAFGYEGDAKQVKEAVKAQREQYQKQQELEQLKQQAEQDGTSPELLREIKELKKEIAELKGEREAIKEAELKKKQADEAWKKEVEQTETELGVDLNKLAEDKGFMEFAQDFKGAQLKSIVKQYLKISGEIEKYKKITEIKQKNEENAKASTGSVKNIDNTQTTYFTREQVDKMSNAEINKHWKQINESMKKW